MIEVRVIGEMDNSQDHTFESANRIYDTDGLCPTINTCQGGGLHPKIIQPISTSGECKEIANTILAGYERTNMTGFNNDNAVCEGQERSSEMEVDVEKSTVHYHIRKLTPKECFRLMGVRDEDYDKLTVSNSQRYKQAGNSIVVDVLMAIFENMFVKDCEESTLF